MDTKYRKFSVALEEGCPVLTVLCLSDFCSLPWLVNCCTHSLQESPEGRKQSLLLIGNRILFHRWSSAIISPCLGVRQARRVRFNLETKTFILPVHYFSLIISYVSETNIRDHIVPWISIQCIFKRHVTHTHTHKTNVHATKNTITAKWHKPESNRPWTPLPKVYSTFWDSHFCSIRCFSYCIWPTLIFMLESLAIKDW